MRKVLPQTDCWLVLPVFEADGTRIEPPATVNFYLYALTGEHAGHWLWYSDSQWHDTEGVAIAGQHIGNGHWKASFASGVWVSGDTYQVYAKDGSGICMPTGDTIVCEAAPPSTFLGFPIDVNVIGYGQLSSQQDGDAENYLVRLDPASRTSDPNLYLDARIVIWENIGGVHQNPFMRMISAYDPSTGIATLNDEFPAGRIIQTGDYYMIVAARVNKGTYDLYQTLDVILAAAGRPQTVTVNSTELRS